MQIQGYFDLKFEAVKDAFAALFEDPQERGAALCVQVAGETDHLRFQLPKATAPANGTCSPLDEAVY